MIADAMLKSTDPVMQRLADEVTNIIWRFMRRGFTAVPAARVKRHALTPHLAAQIRAMKAAHPELLQDEIGRLFNVAGGRVSEALAGHDRSPSSATRRIIP